MEVLTYGFPMATSLRVRYWGLAAARARGERGTEVQEEIHRALFLSATDRFGGCNHTVAVASFSRIEADALCSPVQCKNKVMRSWPM